MPARKIRRYRMTVTHLCCHAVTYERPRRDTRGSFVEFITKTPCAPCRKRIQRERGGRYLLGPDGTWTWRKA